MGTLTRRTPPTRPPPALTPAEIITRLRARDPEGLRALFGQYAPALNAVIYRVVKDQRVAEEVLQDTLLKAWDKIGTYDESTAGLFTWLMVIARHTAIDRVRLRGYQIARQSVALDAHVHDGEAAPPTAAAVDVASLTADMDEKYLAVLRKVYFEGHSASAAAAALDLPVGTVKTRLRAALQHLRAKVARDRDIFFSTPLAGLLAALSPWLSL